MALSITASGVFAPVSGTINKTSFNYVVNSGYIITAGMVVATDPNTGFVVPAMAASGYNYSAVGIALNNAYQNQPCAYCTQGLMSLGTGATSGMIVGQQYNLDYATSGGIIPNNALVSGAYVMQLGYCSASGFFTVGLVNTNIQLA